MSRSAPVQNRYERYVYMTNRRRRRRRRFRAACTNVSLLVKIFTRSSAFGNTEREIELEETTRIWLWTHTRTVREIQTHSPRINEKKQTNDHSSIMRERENEKESVCARVNKRIKETRKRRKNKENKRERDREREREPHVCLYVEQWVEKELDFFFSIERSLVLDQIVLFEVQLKNGVFNSSKYKANILGI